VVPVAVVGLAVGVAGVVLLALPELVVLRLCRHLQLVYRNSKVQSKEKS